MKRLFPIGIFLLGVTILSCSASRNLKEKLLQNDLNNSKWLLYNIRDSSTYDTLEFIFGRLNTGEKINLLVYNSVDRKELCEFRVSGDTILFDSYSTSSKFNYVCSPDCKARNLFVYAERKLKFLSSSTECNGAITRVLDELYGIHFRKL